jgi:type IV fimbrial biogenesis protein FimT
MNKRKPFGVARSLTQARNYQTWQGFTLIELMVTIAVMAILLMVAVPSFKEAMLGSKLGSYANSLVAGAHLARSEAIKRNQVVTLCVSSNGTSCGTGDWGQGWIVRTTGGTVVQHQQALPAGFKVKQTAGPASLGFRPSGVGSDTATFTVCRATPLGGQERVVSISATGRPSVAKTTTGSCS